jgi:1-aminocyclopropane-1-carboxylate deaminase
MVVCGVKRCPKPPWSGTASGAKDAKTPKFHKIFLPFFMLSPSAIAQNWQSLEQHAPSPLTELHAPILEDRRIRLWMKRDDQLILTPADDDRSFCGNKWRKLKYNLLQAKKKDQQPLLTFGGAYSNHIAAVASAGALFGLPTIGIIRGERPTKLNPTLRQATAHGMYLHFISRSAYRQKQDPAFLTQLQAQFGPCAIIPEGGTNALALQGVAELAHEIKQQVPTIPDLICCCCGTGGTLAGLVMGMEGQSQLVGYPALKGDFMANEVATHLQEAGVAYQNWSIQSKYHFGGYAKWQPALLEFIQWFKTTFDVALDPIYTSKLFFGIWDQIQRGQFKEGTTIVLVHSGGLQGIAGFNERFGTTLPLH